jgi:hypothetical protein
MKILGENSKQFWTKVWNYLTLRRNTEDGRLFDIDVNDFERTPTVEESLDDIAEELFRMNRKPAPPNVTDVVVKNDVRVEVPDTTPTFDEQLATAIVGATAAQMLKAPKTQLANYGNDVYRIVAAVIAARNRNQNATNAAHWTPQS